MKQYDENQNLPEAGKLKNSTELFLVNDFEVSLSYNGQTIISANGKYLKVKSTILNAEKINSLVFDNFAYFSSIQNEEAFLISADEKLNCPNSCDRILIS